MRAVVQCLRVQSEEVKSRGVVVRVPVIKKIRSYIRSTNPKRLTHDKGKKIDENAKEYELKERKRERGN